MNHTSECFSTLTKGKMELYPEVFNIYLLDSLLRDNTLSGRISSNVKSLFQPDTVSTVGPDPRIKRIKCRKSCSENNFLKKKIQFLTGRKFTPIEAVGNGTG